MKKIAVSHCCGDMTLHLDEGEVAIVFIPKFREYGIRVLNGGTAFAQIQNCPWCGAQLPGSLRDEWFEQMEALGLEPGDADIPEAYLSAEW